LDNKVLRTVFGGMGEKIKNLQRKFHNERRHNLYSEINILRFIRSVRMKSTVLLACMEESKTATYFSLKTSEQSDFGGLCTDTRAVIQWIMERYDVKL